MWGLVDGVMGGCDCSGGRRSDSKGRRSRGSGGSPIW